MKYYILFAWLLLLSSCSQEIMSEKKSSSFLELEIPFCSIEDVELGMKEDFWTHLEQADEIEDIANLGLASFIESLDGFAVYSIHRKHNIIYIVLEEANAEDSYICYEYDSVKNVFIRKYWIPMT